ncbi:exodeoxyribonuclease III [Candidatus Saccharibacteria bacterium]|nr:exodeoxyribonuclease III [Candidatus Saccharibacteria bacterium]
MPRTLRLYSWNVNGLRAVLRKGALQSFLEAEHPDILCLQEIKCKPAQLDLFESAALQEYEVFWNPALRPGYSGTAILVGRWLGERGISSFFGHPEAAAEDKRRSPVKTGATDAVPKNADDRKRAWEQEGRILILNLQSFYLVNVYTPNSKPDLSRLSLRHDSWDPEFKALLQNLEQEKPVITCGDFNAAHQEIDLARPKTNHHSAGFTDEEREGITNLLQAGFLDSFRTLHPGTQRYTWWSHWGKARENNVGWRIDYFFLSGSLKSRLQSAEIYEHYLGSDHCPISITLELPDAS